LREDFEGVGRLRLSDAVDGRGEVPEAWSRGRRRTSSCISAVRELRGGGRGDGLAVEVGRDDGLGGVDGDAEGDFAAVALVANEREDGLVCAAVVGAGALSHTQRRGGQLFAADLGGDGADVGRRREDKGRFLGFDDGEEGPHPPGDPVGSRHHREGGVDRAFGGKLEEVLRDFGLRGRRDRRAAAVHRW